MRYEMTDCEWTIIQPVLPDKPRGVPRVNDRRVLNGIFWILRSGAPARWLDHAADEIGNKGEPTMTYKVYVDDNFHYMDESERYELGDFPTLKSAVTACKDIVDRDLGNMIETRGPMTANELYEMYVTFGEDPWPCKNIVGRDMANIVETKGTMTWPSADSFFCAWDYAKEQCAVLCRDTGSAEE